MSYSNKNLVLPFLVQYSELNINSQQVTKRFLHGGRHFHRPIIILDGHEVNFYMPNTPTKYIKQTNFEVTFKIHFRSEKISEIIMGP